MEGCGKAREWINSTFLVNQKKAGVGDHSGVSSWLTGPGYFPPPEEEVNRAQPQQSQQSGLAMCQHMHLPSNLPRGSVGAEEKKERKKKSSFCGRPSGVWAGYYDLRYERNRGAFKSPVVATISWVWAYNTGFQGCSISLLNTLPVIWVEIARRRVGLGVVPLVGNSWAWIL